jgi:hypothetical protein
LSTIIAMAMTTLRMVVLKPTSIPGGRRIARLSRRRCRYRTEIPVQRTFYLRRSRNRLNRRLLPSPWRKIRVSIRSSSIARAGGRCSRCNCSGRLMLV